MSSQSNLGEDYLQSLHHKLFFFSVLEYEEVVSKFKVVRSHEDFQWLHSVIEENPAYAGLIIPPRFSSHYIDLNIYDLDFIGDYCCEDDFSGHQSLISTPHKRGFTGWESERRGVEEKTSQG